MTSSVYRFLGTTAAAATFCAALIAGPASAAEHKGGMAKDHEMGRMQGMGGAHGMDGADMMTMVGAVMLEYRFMSMSMDGNRDGSDDLSTAEVLSQGFMMASPEMSMDMHMLMAMYTASERWSWMAMLNYLDKAMDMVTMAGAAPAMKASGVGDLEVAGLYRFATGPGYALTARLGVSLPTGSTDEDNAAGNLPYPMQLGSGTLDLKPGILYQRGMGAWSLRGDAIATLRTGENDEGYTLGDRLELSLQARRRLQAGLSAGLRLSYANWGNIDGVDTRIPTMSPYADPDRQAGSRWDLAVGLDYGLRALTLGIEYSAPLAQDLDGPQMRLDDVVSVKASYMF